MFLVPHSSDQTQPLDLVIFGLFKKYYTRSTFGYLSSIQSNQLVRMYGAWYQATAPHLVILSFMAAGMRPYMIGNMHYYKIDMSLATRIRDWTLMDDTLINDDNATKRVKITLNDSFKMNE